MSVAYKLQYGSRTIDFTVVRRERRTMQISVMPDTTVEVIAPLSANEKDILKRMSKRAGWICKQIRFFQQYLPRTPERCFAAGETHLYLGRRYRLKTIRSAQAGIKLKRGFLEVHTHTPGRTAVIRDQVEQWSRARAQDCFKKRLEACLQKFPVPNGYKPNGLIIRQLKQRWGSMSASGRLVLNRNLLQASKQEIDYVITHELCHRLYLHHGPQFFDLLTRVMPDWEVRKRSLEKRLA